LTRSSTGPTRFTSFDEGKYKSSGIYGSPKDPALKKEYEEYLKKRLAEIQGR
jgi:4-hydroxy-4-methyl-2-oxoglutarate aldolase